MEVIVLPDAEHLAHHAADLITDYARASLRAGRKFVMAVSGGKTPEIMFTSLATRDIDWPSVVIAQVDERVAPLGSEERNLTQLEHRLLSPARIPRENVLTMPVDDDLETACRRYETELTTVAGDPPVLDLVQLGLGADGHTASLVPSDPVLGVDDRDVWMAGPYSGRQRMTLTYPAINRARRIMWIVSGSEKAFALQRLVDGDKTIPAGRVRADGAIALVDATAARLGSTTTA